MSVFTKFVYFDGSARYLVDGKRVKESKFNEIWNSFDFHSSGCVRHHNSKTEFVWTGYNK